MVTTNDKELFDRLSLLRTHGITKNPACLLRAMSDNADEDGHEVLVVKKFSIAEYVATATKIVAAMVESL